MNPPSMECVMSSLEKAIKRHFSLQICGEKKKLLVRPPFPKMNALMFFKPNNNQKSSCRF
jgi:hypothetical protein